MDVSSHLDTVLYKIQIGLVKVYVGPERHLAIVDTNRSTSYLSATAYTQITTIDDFTTEPPTVASEVLVKNVESDMKKRFVMDFHVKHDHHAQYPCVLGYDFIWGCLKKFPF